MDVESSDPGGSGIVTGWRQGHDGVIPGQALGSVPEGIFDHRIMVPFHLHGSLKVSSIAGAGPHTLLECRHESSSTTA